MIKRKGEVTVQSLLKVILNKRKKQTTKRKVIKFPNVFQNNRSRNQREQVNTTRTIIKEAMI